jgi:Fe-S cluster assembly iron-binding protein IscA
LTSGIGTFSATLVTAGNQTITATDSVTSSIAGTSGQINVAQVPHSMTAGSGTTSQLAQINTPFATPLSVTVKDVAGNPIAGLSVTFTAPPTSASGVFSNSTNTITVTTNASGLATAGSFTANTTAGGPYTVTAAATGLTTVTFSLTNTAGAAHSMATGSGTTPQSAAVSTPFTTPLSVTVDDASGNPVAGLSVTFTAPATGASGTFSNSTNTTTVATNGSGVASAGSFTANSTAGGFYAVTAAATGLTTVTFSLTNTAGAAHSMTAGTGTTPQSAQISAPFATPLSVTVDDPSGNPVSGISVTFAAPATGASGTFTGGTNTITATTNASGVASAGTLTANSTVGGPYTVTAAATGLTTVNFALTNTVGVATHFSVVAPSSASQGVAFNFTVTALDAAGNTVTGYAGTVHFTSSDGAATLPANSILSSGTGTFAATLVTAGSQTVTATDTVTSSITGTSGQIPVTQVPHSMTAGASTTPQSAAIQTAFTTPLSVTVKDVAGNPIAGVSVTFTAPATGASGTFSNSTNTITVTTNASGVASAGSFTANSTAGGPYTVTAAATGLTTVNFALTNTAGAAHSMTAGTGTTPQSAAIRTAFGTPLSVVVDDVAGNPVAGVSVTFTAPATGASGTFSNSTNTFTVTTNASGVASAGSFTANSTVGGPYTVTAAATGLSSVTFSLTNTAGVATHFLVVAPTSASQGVTLNFTVTALDANNNTVTGYAGTVHFTSSDGGATLPANATLTSGTGTFAATLITTGSQTITATDTLTSSITGTSGQISVAAPSIPTNLTITSGMTASTPCQASNTITISGSVTVSGNVTCTAGSQIILLPGFTAVGSSGTTFTAMINPNI